MAWGFTNIGDSQDLFVETRESGSVRRFLGPAGFYDARSEEVEIPVRFEASEKLRILHTRHGPLISEDPPIALAWAAQRVENVGLDGLFDLNLATDWQTTSDALDRLPAPSACATYADIEGHVAFRVVGALPIRGRGEGLVPLPGHEVGVAWRGLLPMEDLPRLLDPPDGFTAAANARVNPPGEGPLISADNSPGYRIGRIQEVLSGRHDHTPRDMQRLQMDWRNGQAERLLPRLLHDLGGASLGALPDRSREALEAWSLDPINAPDAGAPLLFLRWYLALAKELFAERLGEEMWPRLLRNSYVMNQAVDGLVLSRDDSPWWRSERLGIVRETFMHAVAEVASELGGEPQTWHWRERHQVYLVHELSTAIPFIGRWLDRGPYPWGGDHATVGRAGYRYDRPERVRSGATMRVVLEMTKPPRARVILPGGQAGHPSDPHYDDQVAPWLAGDLEEIEGGSAIRPVSVLRLEVEGASATVR